VDMEQRDLAGHLLAAQTTLVIDLTDMEIKALEVAHTELAFLLDRHIDEV